MPQPILGAVLRLRWLIIRRKGQTDMTPRVSQSGAAIAQNLSAPIDDLLTAKEAAKLLKVSLSWLAKARKRGDGPPYIKIGRPIRYSKAALLEWLRSHQH
jgi:excisionase family DNA binding protein